MNLSNRLLAALLAGAVVFGSAVGFVAHWALPSGAPAVTLPAEVRVDTPAAVVRAQANGPVKWFSADLGMAVLLCPDDRSCVVTARRDGHYRLFAYAGRGNQVSDPAMTTVIFGDPGPGPGPGPVPPPPPGPEPTDPLWPMLKGVWVSDVSPDKGKYRDLLASVYSRGAEQIVPMPSLKTTVELVQVLHEAAEQILGRNLDGIRRVIADEFNRTLPRKPDQPLDAATREAWQKQLRRVADLVRRLPS
jgi:hypothetical protein